MHTYAAASIDVPRDHMPLQHWPLSLSFPSHRSALSSVSKLPAPNIISPPIPRQRRGGRGSGGQPSKEAPLPPLPPVVLDARPARMRASSAASRSFSAWLRLSASRSADSPPIPPSPTFNPPPPPAAAGGAACAEGPPRKLVEPGVEVGEQGGDGRIRASGSTLSATIWRNVMSATEAKRCRGGLGEAAEVAEGCGVGESSRTTCRWPTVDAAAIESDSRPPVVWRRLTTPSSLWSSPCIFACSRCRCRSLRAPSLCMPEEAEQALRQNTSEDFSLGRGGLGDHRVPLGHRSIAS